jgi:hypothetical protein
MSDPGNMIFVKQHVVKVPHIDHLAAFFAAIEVLFFRIQQRVKLSGVHRVGDSITKRPSQSRLKRTKNHTTSATIRGIPRRPRKTTTIVST